MYFFTIFLQFFFPNVLEKFSKIFEKMVKMIHLFSKNQKKGFKNLQEFQKSLKKRNVKKRMKCI